MALANYIRLMTKTIPCRALSRFVMLMQSLTVVAFTASQRTEQPRLEGTLGDYSQVSLAPVPGGRHVLVAVDSFLLRFDRKSGRAQIVARGRFRNLSLSADGQMLAFDRPTNGVGHVWVARVDAATGMVDSLRQLVAEPSFRPLIAPDGDRVAFTHSTVDGESIACVSRRDGSRRTLPVVGANVVAVGWSTDGEALYYTAPEPRFGRSYSIHRLKLSDTSDEVVIARNFLPNARLSPDGRYLIFKSTSRRLAVASSDGTGMRDLDAVEGLGASFGAPQWVPGEPELLFPSFTERRSVWKASIADGRSDRLTEQEWAAWPAISPRQQLAAVIALNDGAGILLQGPADARPRVLRMEELTMTGPYGPRLTWSPDGKTLAATIGNFERPAHPNPTGILLIDAETGRTRALSTASELQGFIWSRDSRAIRYIHQPDAANDDRQRPQQVRETRPGEPDRLVQELHQAVGGLSFVDFEHVYSWNDGALTDLATGQRHAVLDSEDIPRYGAGGSTGAPTIPSFSPNGQWFVAAAGSSAGGPLDRVALVAVQSGRRRLLEAGLTHSVDLAASWQADNKHVVVTGRDSTGVSRMVLLDIDSGQRRMIGTIDSDREGVMFAQSSDGAWLAVSRRGKSPPVSLLALRLNF